MGSLEIASLFASIGADISGFGKAMKQVSDDLDKQEKSINRFQDIAGRGFKGLESTVSTAFKGIAVAGTAVATTGALIGGAIVKAGIDFNAFEENATTAFTTMLGSGEHAKSFMDELAAFARSTPFEFPDLVTAAQRLMAMGIESSRVMPLLTSVGDAVAAVGGGAAEVDRVTTALGQMHAKGKTSAEEMMQLTEAGIPAWEFLAQAIGVDVATAMEKVSDGAVSAETTINAVTTGINERFGGMMAKQSQTWTGMVSNISDTFTQLSGTVMKPFFGLMEKGLSFIVDFTSKPEFTAGIQAFADKVQHFIDLLGTMNMLYEDGSGLLSEFIQLFGVSGVTAQDVGKAVYDFIQTVKGMYEWVKNTIGQFVEWRDIFTVIAGIVVKMAIPAIASFLVTAAPTIALFAALTAAAAALRKGWEEDWFGIRTTLERVWAVVTDVFDDVIARVANVVEWFRYQWGVLRSTNAELGEYLRATWIAISTGAYQVWSGIVEIVTTLFPPFLEAVTEWGKAAWEWIVDVTPIALEKIVAWGKELLGWLGENLPGWIKTLLEWGTALYEWIGDAIPKAINSLTEFIRGMRKKGDGDGQKSLSDMAGGWMKTLWVWIKDDLIPNVGPAFMDFISAMLNYGRDLLGALGNLAKELGLILWEWIVDITPTAVQKLGEWGRALWDWIRSNAPEWGRKLSEWALVAWQWIQEVIPIALKKLGEWGTALWNWVKENWPAWRDKLLEWGTAAWTWIRDVAIPEALTKLGEWWVELKDWATENWPKWRDELLEWGEAAWTWIRDVAIPEAIKKLGEWLTELKDWLQTKWPTWQEKLTQAGIDMIDWLWDGIDIMWIRLRDWFFGQTAFGGFVGDILEMLGIQLGPAYGVMYKNGERIAYSLNDGSRYGLNSLRQTGSDMGSSITGGLESHMDMHSPSRVMFDLGKNIMLGLQDGIEYYVPPVLDTVKQLATDVATQTSNIAQNVATSLNAAAPQLKNYFQGLIDEKIRVLEELSKQTLPVFTPPPVTAPPTLVDPNAGGNGTQILIPATPTPGNGDYGNKNLNLALNGMSAFMDIGDSISDIQTFAARANAFFTGAGQEQLQGSSPAALAIKALTSEGVGTLSVDKVLAAVQDLVTEIRNRGFGTKFDISQAPDATLQQQTELQELVAYLNALYG